MRTRARGLILLLIVSSVACARQRGEASSARPDPNVITQEEIRQHNFATVYEAVQALHPRWLDARGTNNSSVHVYFDNARIGGVATLRSITLPNVVYIRYFNGIDATQRWGLDHGGGVIFVSTRTNGAQ